MAEYINANFVAWGGDVTRSDAFNLAIRRMDVVSVLAYPYVALLMGSGSSVKVGGGRPWLDPPPC